MIDVEGLDRPGVLSGVSAVLAEQQRLDAHQLALAAHWADLHHPDSLPAPTTKFEAQRRRFDGRVAVQPGGEGTPPVLGSCFRELGVVLQSTARGARYLVADALDLRHRLPLLWREVQAGGVRAWKARRVAQATRHLPQQVMAQVDAGLAGLLSSLAWTRFEAVLDATVQRADPAGAAHREAEAASRRFVALGLDGGPGLKTLIARGEVLDILTFLAAVNRIADILALEGDPDGVEVRRSKAVGILGQPDRALTLLMAHRDDTDRPAPPAESPGRRSSHRPDDEPTHPEPVEWPPAEPDEAEPDEAGTRSLNLTHPAPAATDSGVRIQLHVHLTDTALTGTGPAAVCRVEGTGPLTATTVRRWLGRTDAKITVRPVTIPGHAIPVDAYEIPHSIRQAVLQRSPASVFPWSTSTDRHRLQLDHIQPHRSPARGGPPGQTRPDNLAPLAGSEHQGKTSGDWHQHSPAPGVHLWRSPHGWIHLVTNQGTYPLGATATARAIWRASAPVLDAELAA